MQANELRIGNWVQYDKQFCKVDAICNYPNDKFKKVSIKGENLFAELPFADIQPIQLTKDIMLKIGFEFVRDTGYWRHFKLKTGWHISEWISDESTAGFEEKGVFYYGDDYIPVKTLHHLQNLYYALWQKELEINL